MHTCRCKQTINNCLPDNSNNKKERLHRYENIYIYKGNLIIYVTSIYNTHIMDRKSTNISRIT